MSESPNKLIRFWQELKRRKVFSVITTYAATAYIIIEVVNNLIGPLHLPDWLATLVVTLLIIGLPVVIILSWIFDFTPQGIKKTESLEELENKEIVVKPVKSKLRASYVLNAVLLIAVIVLAYPKIFKRNTLEKLRSSGEKITVAVMPFQNMTGDSTKNFWQEMIQDNLITSLSNSEELKVRQTESISTLLQSNDITNYASIAPTVAGSISQKLNANVFVLGSISKTDSTIRLNAKLIDSNTEEVFKSFQIDGTAKNILHLADSLSVIARDFLVVSELEKGIPKIYNLSGMTNSPDAYRCFILGRNEFMKEDYLSGINWFTKAIAIDSNFFQAMILTSLAFNNHFEYETWFSSVYDKLYLYEEAKKWCLRAYKKMDQMTMQQKINMQWLYARLFETKYEEIKYLKQLIQTDDQWVSVYFNLGNSYYESKQYEQAIPEYNKALEIYEKWGLKPYWAFYYTYLGQMYYKTGQYKKAEKVFKTAEKDFPDDPELIGWRAVLALSQGDTIEANRYFKSLSTSLRNMSLSEATITSLLAFAYNEAGVPEKAEEYYRLAQSLESDNPDRVNSLAYFLIDKNRNVNEGVELIDKVLEVIPENFIYLHTKGWGLYKQTKYNEALDVLQKSWDLRREKAVYDHEAFLHLEAAKKAVAGQKVN
jgi:tetratricopeptide (TPR) repeat protein